MEDKREKLESMRRTCQVARDARIWQRMEAMSRCGLVGSMSSGVTPVLDSTYDYDLDDSNKDSCNKKTH